MHLKGPADYGHHLTSPCELERMFVCSEAVLRALALKPSHALNRWLPKAGFRMTPNGDREPLRRGGRGATV